MRILTSFLTKNENILRTTGFWYTYHIIFPNPNGSYVPYIYLYILYLIIKQNTFFFHFFILKKNLQIFAFFFFFFGGMKEKRV